MFIGMVLGVAAAAGVAWYLAEKKPAFTNKESSKPAQQVAPLVASAPVAATPPTVAASGVAEPKQHFEFQGADRQGQCSTQKHRSRRGGEGTGGCEASSRHAPGASKDLYYVQAGSFQNVGDARN
jgi:hypothetical protein